MSAAPYHRPFMPARPTDGRIGRLVLATLLSTSALLLVACSSTPKGGSVAVPRPSQPAPAADRDGPEANPPPDLHKVPDAEPKVEAVLVGGPNKPYAISGKQYTPATSDEPLVERGLASWYGRKFHGRRTASGEVYNMYAMTAAHRTFPIPSYARVRNPANGREVIVRINDRGPFTRDRVVDVSYTAALKLGILGGVAPVEVERITHEAIRNGSWRRDGLAAAPPSAGLRDERTPGAVMAATPEWGDPIAAPADARIDSPTWPTAPLPVAEAAPPPSAAAYATAARAAKADALDGAGDQPVRPPAGKALPTERAGTVAARGWWLQLGAFKASDGATQFHRRIAGEADWLAPLMTLFHESALHKLQAGPFPSRDEALAASQRLRSQLQLVPMLVERR